MPTSPTTLQPRRVPFGFVLLLLLLLGITACRDFDSAVAPGLSDAGGAAFSLQESAPIPDRYIVTFQPGVADPPALARALAAAHGGTVHYTYTSVLQGFALSVPAQGLEGIRRNPNVRAIEPDQLVSVAGVQTPATWGLDRIDQPTLPLSGSYTYDTDAAGVAAYIFDTGIRYDHSEFEGRASFGFDAFSDGRNGLDCHGHGTHVAGTVGGKTWGVAKKASLVAVRVLDCTGYGSYSGMIAGMDWVVKNNHGPAVANFSLGGSVSSALNSALTNMIAAGVATAVSAGNDNGDACQKSPASTPAAVTVGATTSSDYRASYSNYGSCVDIFAPGTGITSASYASATGSTSMSGTSMASPHVTGVLALLKAQRPDLTSQQLRDWLVVTLSAKNAVFGANSTNAHLLQSRTAGSAPPPTTTTPTDTVVVMVPAAPASLKASVVGKTKVKVSWTDVATNEAGFRIERRTGSAEWVQVGAAGANATNFTDSSTTAGQAYSYRAYAYNAAGNSSSSNEYSIVVGNSTTTRK